MNGDAHVHRQPDANNDMLDVRSQQLIILPDDDVVYTDLPAEVLKGRSRMNGKGMHYNNKTRQLQVSASTDVEIAGSEGKQQRRTEIPANNTDQKKP
jgi:lipopolysaccharide export system protein LptC